MKDYLNNDVIVYRRKGNVEYIQFKRLLEYKEITHCYTLKSNDLISFEPVYKNEKKLKQSYEMIGKVLNINPNDIIKPHQTHTDNIVNIKEKLSNEKMEDCLNEVDGLITNKKNIALLTTSADCTSILFYDTVKKVIGSIHSGWRGTLKGISKRTVLKIVEEYNSNPKDIICGICPTIRKCCFEVEDDVKNLFKDKYCNMKNINKFITKGDIKDNKQRYFIDTVEINKQLLMEAGIKEENILDSGICTKCNYKDFHSYRAEKEKSGRNGAIIYIN